jgi:hypothetical protein
VTADPDELDAPFCDQSADEPRRGAQTLGRRFDGQELIAGLTALPVAKGFHG